MDTVKVGVIGCGNIVDVYLKNMIEKYSNTEVLMCADINMDKANAVASRYHITAVTVDELLSNDEIEIVVNLTVPKAHYEVNEKILKANKHVYAEKPLALTREDGLKLLKLAEEKNKFIGCAPDTFLGAGLQTCRKLIEDGWIGKPVAATGIVTNHGPESWHPNPFFIYQNGFGPLFDVGPYYLTALINLIGPIQKVSAMTTKTYEERTITNDVQFGQKIKVEVPTHITGQLEFKNGAIGTLITSYDLWENNTFLKIHGTEGSLKIPDPNFFGDKIYYLKAGSNTWKEIPYTHGYDFDGRGIGVSDLAYAIQNNKTPRTDAKLAYHVLDVMRGIYESGLQEKYIMINSTCDKPKLLPLDYDYRFSNFN